jgi:hypothetical protein
MPEPKNMYEWMVLNGEKLADAIKEDGRMCGPLSDPLLTDLQRFDSDSKQRREAKSLLHAYLTLRNVGHLMP